MDINSRILRASEKNWYKRAQIIKAIPVNNILINQDRPDFLLDLLPFNNHPLWKAVADITKKIVMSYGWVMYNLKTIRIETNIVTPFCNNIINGNFEALGSRDFKRIVSQTLVDEGYHTLLSVDGCRVIIENRNLDPINLPLFNFERNLSQRVSSCKNNTEKELVLLGNVVTSEVLISDYLATISTSEIIQPFCKAITMTHWKDEAAHSNIFKLIAEDVFNILDKQERDFLLTIIVDSAEWFRDRELECWKEILLFSDCPRAEDIIEDTREIQEDGRHQLIVKQVEKLITHLRTCSSSSGNSVANSIPA